MSVVSLGLYDAYWIYRNWRYLKERDGLPIQPFWRGIFGLFFFHSLLKTIETDDAVNRIQKATFSPGSLAAGWIIVNLLGRALSRGPEPGTNLVGILISCSSFAFLLPVQNYINAINEASVARPPYYEWSPGHIVCLVIGIVMWSLILAPWIQ
ncbi:MAG TPA: hypothetical protein VNP98_04735 [Chthoniobacterales bacterium]|nr:hypothetical protein [Chthoniobacterales bacterium]